MVLHETPAAWGICGSEGKRRCPSDLQAQEEEERILMEQEQLQPVGFPAPGWTQSSHPPTSQEGSSRGE